MAAPKIIFLPGLDGNGFYCTPLKNLLAQEYDCAILTYPLGLTDLDKLVSWVCGQFDAQSDYIIIGQSFGGPVAIKVAIAASGRVKGLVLASTFCKPPLPAFMLNFMGFMYPLMIKQTGLSLHLINWLMRNNDSPELARNVRRTLTETPPETIVNRIRSLAHLDVSAEAASLTIPVLVLKPNQDRLARLSRFKMPAHWPTEHIDGPHELLGTQAEACFRVISGFIKAQT